MLREKRQLEIVTISRNPQRKKKKVREISKWADHVAQGKKRHHI